MDDQQRARRLSARGYDHLRSGAWFEAVKVGHALRILRHPAGHELCALGLAGMGEVAGAVEALEEGVRVAQGSWELWDLLGVFRAEQGDLDCAQAAFDEALLCPEPDEDLVHLHAALSLWAAGRAGRALERLSQGVEGPPSPGREALHARREALRAQLQLDLMRPAAAEEVARRALALSVASPEPSEPALRAALAELQAARAVACWRSRGDRGEALSHARRALALDESNGSAGVVLRRLGGGGARLRTGSAPVWRGDGDSGG